MNSAFFCGKYYQPFREDTLICSLSSDHYIAHDFTSYHEHCNYSESLISTRTLQFRVWTDVVFFPPQHTLTAGIRLFCVPVKLSTRPFPHSTPYTEEGLMSNSLSLSLQVIRWCHSHVTAFSSTCTHTFVHSSWMLWHVSDTIWLPGVRGSGCWWESTIKFYLYTLGTLY